MIEVRTNDWIIAQCSMSNIALPSFPTETNLILGKVVLFDHTLEARIICLLATTTILQLGISNWNKNEHEELLISVFNDRVVANLGANPFWEAISPLLASLDTKFAVLSERRITKYLENKK